MLAGQLARRRKPYCPGEQQTVVTDAIDYKGNRLQQARKKRKKAAGGRFDAGRPEGLLDKGLLEAILTPWMAYRPSWLRCWISQMPARITILAQGTSARRPDTITEVEVLGGSNSTFSVMDVAVRPRQPAVGRRCCCRDGV